MTPTRLVAHALDVERAPDRASGAALPLIDDAGAEA